MGETFGAKTFCTSLYKKAFEGRLPVDSRTGQAAFRQNKMYGTSQSGDAFPPERDSALPNYNLKHFSTLSEIRKKRKKKKKKEKYWLKKIQAF